MICAPCRTAGLALTLVKQQGRGDFGVTATLLNESAMWHEHCEYPASCGCQHDTSLDALNRERIK